MHCRGQSCPTLQLKWNLNMAFLSPLECIGCSARRGKGLEQNGSFYFSDAYLSKGAPGAYGTPFHLSLSLWETNVEDSVSHQPLVLIKQHLELERKGTRTWHGFSQHTCHLTIAIKIRKRTCQSFSSPSLLPTYLCAFIKPPPKSIVIWIYMWL